MADDSERETVILDGSNVAHAGEKNSRLDNIRLVCRKLHEEGYQPFVVVDASLRHDIDESDKFEHMVDDGRIRQAPAGTDADYFILSFARELDARIVSNDLFREHRTEFPDADDRVIRYMIVDGRVVLEHGDHRRGGGS